MWNATRRLGIMAGILVAFNATALADKPAEPALSPAEVGKLMLTADSWTESQMYALARHVRASMYIFIPADLGPVLYESGNPMLMLGKDYGGVFEVGDTARRGVYWNFSRESAKVRIGEGPNVTHLPSGALLIVGDIMVRDKAATRIAHVGPSGEQIVSGQGTVRVECRPGYFACCMYNFGSRTMTAKCIANDDPNAPKECDSGGPGASECTIHDDW